jgi:acetate kinase
MTPGNLSILTINGGSSSIKFAMYGMSANPNKILSGQLKRIGLHNPEFIVTQNASKEIIQIKIDAKDFKKAAEFLIDWLKKQKSFDQINCIGHRIVHGMEHTEPVIIDDNLLSELNKIREYDPDHLPAEIGIIELFKKQFPTLLQVACFDTSFHATMPRVAKILPIPRRFDKAGIRRYGFHGLSYAYLMEVLKNIKGADESNGRIILAHLGSGSSSAAVKEGKSLDTTMGFSPAGGLVMGTRPGDVDPGVAWYMMHSEQMNAKQFNYLINHESGLLGVSEISSDMQDLLNKESSDVRAAEAVALFCYQVKKWIGAFAAVLDGLDTLVFSGGIGENASVIRSRICKDFSFLEIEIDEEENKKNATVISKVNSKVKVYVIPTDEEIIIAKSTKELYINAQNKTQ